MTIEDAYPAARHFVQAVEKATALPALVLTNVAENPIWHKGTPQGSPTSWAFSRIREHHLNTDHATILLALAQHAHAALFSGEGYNGTTAEDICELLGEDTVFSGVIDTILVQYLLPAGLVRSHSETRWLIPDDALDGNWLDRAARNAHYGTATDHVRR